MITRKKPGGCSDVDIVKWCEGNVEARRKLQESEAEVARLIAERGRMNAEFAKEGLAPIFKLPEDRVEEGVKLTTVFEWAARTGSEVEWLWHEAIPMRHLTLIQAKQKIGKSTLVRNLMSNVLHGRAFLGRAVKYGGVIYLPLEEEPASVLRHLQALGVTAADDLLIPVMTQVDEYVEEGVKKRMVERTVVEHVDQLENVIRTARPVLVVIDPLILFLKCGDSNSYDKVYAAMKSLLRLAREYNCAIVLLHHEGKTERENTGQRGIGSTAIPASVSTTISMVSQGGFRMLESEGRGIVAFEKLVLKLDERGTLTSDGSYSEVATNKFESVILDTLRDYDSEEAPTKDELLRCVAGDVKEKETGFYGVLKQGLIVVVSGSGRKGSPRRYGVPVESDVERSMHSKPVTPAPEAVVVVRPKCDTILPWAPTADTADLVALNEGTPIDWSRSV